MTTKYGVSLGLSLDQKGKKMTSLGQLENLEGNVLVLTFFFFHLADCRVVTKESAI